MSNTIQFNNKEYHRIAAKRDVEAVSQIRYGFFYTQWDVLIDGTYYLFANSKPINGVYNLVGTNITIPESAITKTVYEGMEVLVNIPNNTPQSIGTLHINSHYFNYGCSKSTVELSAACSLKLPSANYTARRLVREEDIIKPDTVKLYFDENYINVECFIKFGVPNYSIVTGTYTGYITRSINDGLNVTVLRSRNSQSYITCHIGDTIKIISKKKSLTNVAIRSYTELAGDYPIIAPVDENGNVNTINLQKDGSFDYIIRTDCFITFDITTANYILYGAILEDTEYCDRCAVQVNNTDFIIAGSTELAKRVILENNKVDLNIGLSVYTIDAYTKKRDFVFAGEPEYVLVDINNNVIYDTNGSEVYVDTEYNGDSLLTNAQLLIILSDSTSLPLAVQGWYNLIEVINLTTNEYVTVTTTGSSHSSNYSAYFTMPSADCLLTVNTKIVTDGDTVTISPLYSLTIEVDENSKDIFPISITTGNTTTLYNSSTTIQNIENNYFSATWNEVDGKLYHILYKSNHTTFDDYTTKTVSYSNSLMGNRTLSISLIDPDILYRNTTEISTITAGKEYEENNNIISNSNTIMGLNDLPRRTYYANTESSIKTSGNHFTNLQNLKKVVFNNADTTFTINEDAFYECNKLESVSINGTENIKVKDRAFYNAIMLNEFDDLNKITELGHSCFYGVGLEEYTANTELSVIPELAFSESLLSTANLAGTSINPAMLSTINNRAFKNCLKLTNVHLPYALSTLGQSVFENTAIPCVHTNPAYTSETIFSPYGVVFNADSEYKNGLTTLPSYTFEFCKYLEEVHLPSSITHIEKCAFHKCDNLKHFASPGLKTIALDAFKDTWIEGVASDQLTEDENANSNLDTWSSKLFKRNNTSGILFDTARQSVEGLNKNFSLFTYISPDETNTNLILYSCCDKLRGGILDNDGWNYNLHQNTISISPYACSGNLNIQNFQCLESNRLKSIGDYAFKDNRYIRHISMPESGSVLNIGTGAFYGCTRLSEVTQFTQQPIVKIPDYCFYKCGNNKYGIGASMDAGFMNLEFYIPDSVTEIGNYAFADCPQLMAIANLPTCKITKIGDYAFKNCFNNTAWRAAYGKYLGLKIAYYVCQIITTVASFGVAGAAQVAADLAENIIMYGPELTKEAGKLLVQEWIKQSSIAVGAAVAGSANLTTTVGTTAVDLALSDGKLLRAKARSNTAEVPMPYLKEIGEGCFEQCDYISTIVLHSDLKNIPARAFYDCKRLTRLQFVDDSYILNQPFTKFVFPSIETVGKQAFYNCHNLDYDFVSFLLKNTKSILEKAFKGAKLFITSEEEDTGLFIVIPESLKIIESEALAFSNRQCSVAVFISQNPSNLLYHPNMFGSIQTIKDILIPEGSLSEYKNIFGDKFNIVEMSLSNIFWEGYEAFGYTIPWLTD